MKARKTDDEDELLGNLVFWMILVCLLANSIHRDRLIARFESRLNTWQMPALVFESDYADLGWKVDFTVPIVVGDMESNDWCKRIYKIKRYDQLLRGR